MLKKSNSLHGIALLMSALLLSACGSKSTSTTAVNTVPIYATVFYAHNFVPRNNTFFAAGYNGFGQLGTGSLVNSYVPSPIWGNPRFAGIAAGGDHSVAFFNNSTVRSWGYNAFGQLGNGTVTYSSFPVKTHKISNVVAVSAGGYHTLALKSDDTLWAWGGNESGQLGVQNAGFRAVPVRVGSGFAFFSNISSIAAGGTFSLARASGSVWAWGDNSMGQVGLNPHVTFDNAAPLVVAGSFSGGIAGIAAGGASSYAVDRATGILGGNVWAWGNNENGQLGNNSILPSYVPLKVQKIGGGDLTNVVQVVAGIQHALARCSDGSVWSWGYNAFGQLGNDPTLKQDSHVARPVLADTSFTLFSAATDIRAFGSSSMVKKGGHWYVWGDNTYGQLGLGTTGIVNLPVIIPGF